MSWTRFAATSTRTDTPFCTINNNGSIEFSAAASAFTTAGKYSIYIDKQSHLIGLKPDLSGDFVLTGARKGNSRTRLCCKAIIREMGLNPRRYPVKQDDNMIIIDCKPKEVTTND